MTKDRVVSIDYAIRLVDDEEIVESTRGTGPLEYLHGRAQIVRGVERALEGAEAGTVREVEVGPDEGYGDRDPQAMFLVPRGAFPKGEDIAPGMTFTAMRPDGQGVIFSIVRIEDGLVLVDTNHPLAGRHLRVWVAVRSVRAATIEELRTGRIGEDLAEAPLPS